MAENGKPKAKRAPKNGYKMPEKIAKGETLNDVSKVSWVIGPSIGIGGFGEIYAGAKASEPTQMRYAVKIEPLENGPLFCEKTVYINIGKKEDIADFVRARKLKYLGIPVFHGFGSHTYKKTQYRFIVIDKLGKDIFSFFKTEKSIPYPTILKIGLQILNVYEYMHSKGYVHCDVKSTNLLLGEAKGSEHHVHVVDFGLACKFVSVFTPNPKKAHNGTIEYTSRDAHQGVMTRRGDIEVLGYNLLEWATGRLPWEGIADPPTVQTKKEAMMKAPDKLIEACYKTKTPHAAIKDFFSTLSKMEPLDEPDYNKLRDLLSRDLKKLGSDMNKLEFKAETTSVKSPVKRKRGEGSRKNLVTAISQLDVRQNNEDDSEEETQPASTGKRKQTRVKPESAANDSEVRRKSPRRKATTSTASSAATASTSSPVVKKSWRDCPTIVNGASDPAPSGPPRKIRKR